MRCLISIILLVAFCTLMGEIEVENFYEDMDAGEGQPEIEIALLELEETSVAINFENLEVLLIIPGIERQDILKLQKIVSKKLIMSRIELTKRGIPEDVMRLLDPYISYSKPSEQKFRVVAVTAFTDSSITSSSLRSKFQWGDVELGFLINRIEEEAWKDVFYPFYFSYDCYPCQLIVGQYALRWGQGLLHAPAFRLGFGRSAGSVLSNSGKIIRPYTSSFANKYASGAALQLSLKNLQTILFVSETSLAVNYADSMLISSITDGCEADKFSTLETCYGGAIVGKSEKLRLGLLAEKLVYSADFATETGWQELENCSGWLEYGRDNLQFSSELAWSEHKWAGTMVTSYGSCDFKQYLLLRSYQADFPDIHGNPVARKSHFGGEEGMYYGIALKPAANWQINLYTDLYYFPAARYLVDLPSSGAEQMISLKYGKGDNYLEAYGRYKNAEQYAAIADSGKVIPVENGQYQITLSQEIQKIILRSRLYWRWEAARETNKYQRGFALYQQAGRKIGKSKIWLRLTAFRGELPLYLYENNLRYSFKQVCLTGDGYRLSILLTTNWKNCKGELKYFYERNDEGAKQGLLLGVSVSKK
jgi:hypothetical protein